MIQMIRGSRRQRGQILPSPPSIPVPPVTTLAKRVIVACAVLPVLVATGRTRFGAIPPRVHAQVRPAPIVLVSRGRVDVARGRSLVLPRPIRATSFTHPEIVLPTSAALAANSTGVILVGR